MGAAAGSLTSKVRISKAFSKALAVAMVMTIGLSEAAHAESCLQLTLYGLKEFDAAPDTATPRTVFKLNEQFVMCVQLDAPKFVTVWDAPPKGFAPERLYPNAVSHPKQSVRAVKLRSTRHCYGSKFRDDDAFPLVQDEGPGKGKITVVATDSEDDQPTLEDYAIPGRTLKPQVASNLFSRAITVEATKACDAIASALVEYEVIK